MEDGELEEMAVTIETQKRGEKRNLSMLDDDDVEENFSIQPPPVSSKKHKRHKKHKTGKEEKKKKRHRKSVDDKSEDSERRYATQDDALISRVSDSTRRDYLKHKDRTRPVSDMRAGRDNHYRSKTHPDKDYSNREKVLSSRPHSSRPQSYKSHHDRVPSYPPKPRHDKFYDRDRPSMRGDEGATNKHRKPLIVRTYEDDYERTRSRDLVSRDADKASWHERSVSSSVVITSVSRHNDAATENSYRKRRDRSDERINDANGHSNNIDRPQKSTSKLKRELPNNYNTEIVSTDTSESSDSPESESEEEIPIVKKVKRKKLKKEKVREKIVVEEEKSSSEEEEEEVSAASSSEVGSEDSAASNLNEDSGSDEETVEEEDEDDDEEEVLPSEEEDSYEAEEEQAVDDDGYEEVSEPDDEYISDVDKPAVDSDLGGADLGSPYESPEREPELPYYYPALQGCRSVDEFQCLNRIEEGTYGVVYRAKHKHTDEVVALKRLKMEKEREGFPITSLREVSTLLKSHHPNIVRVQEIVVGSNVDKIYIVMDYVEHDLKSLMETMKQPFLVGEVKTLMIQLLSGVHHLHDNWILHRDLKTSNLLLSHKGILKIGDFGLAREYGSPLKPYTPIVVTLWYRSPELLLGAKEYSTAVDMWSVGCIFAELLNKKALFPGKSEIMQLNLIFKELGTPSEKIWPGYNELPIVKKTTFTNYPYNSLRKRFGATDISEKGFDLLNRFLTYCPERRVGAYTALQHEWFHETPKPVEPSMFPTWPAKSEMTKNKRVAGTGGGSPRAPEGGMGYNKLLNEEEKLGFQLTAPKHGLSKHGMGFSLKF